VSLTPGTLMANSLMAGSWSTLPRPLTSTRSNRSIRKQDQPRRRSLRCALAKVVKAFHPRFAGTLAAPQGSGQGTRNVLLAGDDADAKRQVSHLFKEGGLRPIDVGRLRRAREVEAVGYLYLVTRVPLEGGFLAGR